ncbi:MAG TPA: globin [Chloroflexota bacterium]
MIRQVFVHLETQATRLYERVGGEPFFTALVDQFYDGLASDPLLRPLYPDDLGPPRRHLALFLIQYWGGPRTYSDERGHPRLRMRHVPFAIGTAERSAWLSHMLAAVQASPASAEDRDTLATYFETAATSLLNRPT